MGDCSSRSDPNGTNGFVCGCVIVWSANGMNPVGVTSMVRSASGSDAIVGDDTGFGLCVAIGIDDG